MAIDVVRGSSDKPAVSDALVSAVGSDSLLDGCLFIGYPIIGTAEGQHRIDALWVSPHRGVVVFDLIEGPRAGDYAARQDDSANKLDARLRVHRELVTGREIAIPILMLCRRFLKSPRRLVYAYDELQNLERESLPSPEAIFGADAHGKPAVRLEEDGQDIVLRTCYRNPGPLLATAHGLGFGVYRTPPPTKTTGLVQMFDSPALWDDVGYQVTDGNLEEGKQVSLARTPDSSPEFLSKHSSADDLIRFEVFDNEADQAAWLAAEIKQNLTADELRPNDIMVVHPEPFSTRKRVGPVRQLLFDAKIPTYLAGVDANRDVFWPEEPSVVFSTVHRAKGNEAAMVYVMDAHECQSNYNLARLRNRLFAAITRSKAWVRVTGVGPDMAKLEAEFHKVVEYGFQLCFRYPTASERKDMRIAHRDRTTAEINKARRDNSNVKTLIDDLKAGEVSLADLDQDAVAELRTLLGRSP